MLSAGRRPRSTRNHTQTHIYIFTQALHTQRRVPHGGGSKGRHAHGELEAHGGCGERYGSRASATAQSRKIAFTASSRILLLRRLEQLLERKFRAEPVKRHRGEPGHTHGTHGRTRSHGSHSDEPHNHPNPPTVRHTHSRTTMTESAADSTAAAQGGGGERYLCSLGFRGKKTPGGVGTYRGTHGRTRGKRATHSVRIRTYRRTVSVTAHAWRVTGRFSSDSIPAHIARPVNSFHFRRHTRAHHTSVPDSSSSL